MISIVQWAVAVIAGVLSVMLIVFQPIHIFRGMCQIARQNEDRHISSVLIIGSLAGVIAVLCIPVGAFDVRLTLWWTPFAAEMLSVTFLWVVFQVTGLAKALRAQQAEHRQKRALPSHS